MTMDGLDGGIEVEGDLASPAAVPYLLPQHLIQVADFDHLGLTEQIQTADDRSFHRKANPFPKLAQPTVVR